MDEGLQRALRTQGRRLLDESLDLLRREDKGGSPLRPMPTEDALGRDCMAAVLRMEVASQVNDCPEPSAASQGTALSGPNPLKDGWGTDQGFSLGRREASEVAKDPLLIVQPKSGSPTGGEVGIDSDAQHDTTSGQGWAA